MNDNEHLVKPWQTTDPRTGTQWHWSYNPNISFAAGIAVGVLIVVLGSLP